MPPAGLFRVHLDAQIDTAQNFQYSHLRINYMLKLPAGKIKLKFNYVIDHRIVVLIKSSSCPNEESKNINLE